MRVKTVEEASGLTIGAIKKHLVSYDALNDVCPKYSSSALRRFVQAPPRDGLGREKSCGLERWKPSVRTLSGKTCKWDVATWTASLSPSNKTRLHVWLITETTRPLSPSCRPVHAPRMLATTQSLFLMRRTFSPGSFACICFFSSPSSPVSLLTAAAASRLMFCQRSDAEHRVPSERWEETERREESERREDIEHCVERREETEHCELSREGFDCSSQSELLRCSLSESSHMGSVARVLNAHDKTR